MNGDTNLVTGTAASLLSAMIGLVFAWYAYRLFLPSNSSNSQAKDVSNAYAMLGRGMIGATFMFFGMGVVAVSLWQAWRLNKPIVAETIPELQQVQVRVELSPASLDALAARWATRQTPPPQPAAPTTMRTLVDGSTTTRTLVDGRSRELVPVIQYQPNRVTPHPWPQSQR